jgi:cbb3-type cytochrome oxidase subunit 3
MAHLLSEETSLTLKRKAVLKETGALGLLIKAEAALAVALVAAGTGIYFWRGSATVLMFGVLMAVFFFAHRIKIKENEKEARRVQAGLKGEAEVTRLLVDTLDNHHYILNDFIVKLGRKSAQIDHLVISPKGMFVLETKNWYGHIEGDENGEFWQRTRQPGQPPERVPNPIKQNRRHLEVLREKLQQCGIDWPDITGLVVFTSPRATHYVHNGTMSVLNPKEATEGIARFKARRVYREDEITAVLNVLMKRR